MKKQTRHCQAMAVLVGALSITLTVFCASAMAKPNKDGSLPPGLQKKMERGGELPPGWKKKLMRGSILEPAIYSHAVIVKPVDNFGVVTVSIEGEVVRLLHATHEIVDVLSR